MYFWRIEKLKKEMDARPLTDREALPYLVVFVALSAVASYFPQEAQNVWDRLEAVLSLLLSTFGTIYIYYRNGGANGQHFLQRYLAIGWVVTIRLVPILILVFIAFHGALVAVKPRPKARVGIIFYFLQQLRRSFIGELVIMLRTWRSEHRALSTQKRRRLTRRQSQRPDLSGFRWIVVS
jgi:hypothetical protein